MCALRTASNLAGKLARWSFFLEEFNYRLEHKSGATLTNADGLSRCATADSHPSDGAIRLETIASALEEEGTYADVYELFEDAAAVLNTEGEIMEVNRLAKFIKAYPCRHCQQMIGEAKGKICCACGEAVHVSCLKSKPGVGYWFCDDCAPKFRNGHEDAALNLPLHNLLRGAAYYLGADRTHREQLKTAYRFVRGCLVWSSPGGDRIIPPPCLREEIVQKVHDDLMHQGWERTAQVLGETYFWKGMREETRRICQACLSCQLASGVFRRSDKLFDHLRADIPREAWSIDLAPGLKTSGGARKNIVVCVDDFSKFVILGNLEERTSRALKEWFLTHVLGPYGRPLQVRTDRGSEFAGAFASMLHANNVHHIRTRPHAPWTNGRAERMVGTVKACIRRVMHEYNGDDWELLLPYLCNAINACAARSTHLSPAEVFLGEPGRPLVHQFEEVVGGKLAEASPEVI